MSKTIPHIPPPLGTNSDSTGNLNPTRVDTMPTNDIPNTIPTNNISQSVVDENLPQLLNSRGGSHVTSHERPSDTRDTKIAALRLKFNAFKSLEGEKVLGTFTRLTCLLNDLENNGIIIPQVEVNITFVNSLPRKWLSMNQTQRVNNSIKNDGLASLYGKYSYKEGLIDEIYDGSVVEEDQRTSNEFMPDLNVEYQERALLDKDYVSLEDEETTKIRAFMAITEDQPSVGKADARFGQ
ncbi:hypothetical protein Tco_0073732 [Tanacetum coccineum]